MKTIRILPKKKGEEEGGVHLPLPPDAGRGGVSMMSLASGIQLLFSDYSLHETTRMEYASFPAVFGFGFCLSGEILNQPGGFKAADAIGPDQSAVFHFTGESMKEVVARRRVIRLNIMMEPEKVEAFLGNELQMAIPSLHKLLRHPYRAFDSLTPAMKAALLQLASCPYEGRIRSLFMEGKALELMACKLDQLHSRKGPAPPEPGLKTGEIDRIHYAGELLIADLENPITLSEAARQAGMCRSRFHYCFREVYGMTPFHFLRHQRLEAAGRFLCEGKLNVTQAACAVGYASVSHFTKAFRQHTGCLPGQYRKKEPAP
ncbi:AraC family transcriptional regulator [Desulfobotulus sp. H1]|uniref:AraC family transcriptional regulator n=1 Tax=Desulfobotulus pelophilus TaxID=2823377 RepID=A0ABT3N8V5_9BACT|nr:AraC family transcriptional regulator [Desulfobotulus pelophilus]MCW7753890.1 AraC family transcriptional regulator [Desulfobotulus pelophilus]